MRAGKGAAPGRDMDTLMDTVMHLSSQVMDIPVRSEFTELAESVAALKEDVVPRKTFSVDDESEWSE